MAVDLIRELEERLQELRWYSRHDSLAAACRHITIAQTYLARARRTANVDMFNDVVYRCNQAFEGMLEEVYIASCQRGLPKGTLHALEKALTDSGALPHRVCSVIDSYRRDWRNTSTHEHQAMFSEQEALLALVNVAALALVLSDQIIAATATTRERAERQAAKAALAETLSQIQQPLITRVVSILQNFVNDLQLRPDWPSTEAELTGRVEGFLLSVDAKLVSRHA